MTPTVRLAHGMQCVSAATVEQVLRRTKYEEMLVSTVTGESVIKGVRVTVKGCAKSVIADRITGTLYDEETGECWSGGTRRLIGPAPKGWRPKESVEIVKHEATPQAPRRRMAELSREEIERIREKRPSTNCFRLQNVEAQQMFWVSKATIDNVRRMGA